MNVPGFIIRLLTGIGLLVAGIVGLLKESLPYTIACFIASVTILAPVIGHLFKKNKKLLPTPTTRQLFSAKNIFTGIRRFWGFIFMISSLGEMQQLVCTENLLLLPFALFLLSPADRIVFDNNGPLYTITSGWAGTKEEKALIITLRNSGWIVFLVGVICLNNYPGNGQPSVPVEIGSMEYVKSLLIVSGGIVLMFLHPVLAWIHKRTGFYGVVVIPVHDPQKASDLQTMAADLKKENYELSTDRLTELSMAINNSSEAAIKIKPSSVTENKNAGQQKSGAEKQSGAGKQLDTEKQVAVEKANDQLPIISDIVSETAAGQPVVTAQTDPQLETYLNQIRKGENSTIEFKSTLRVNLHTGKPDKVMEQAVLKTIAAFLNSAGGTLFIGVNDEKEILGLENDFTSFSKPDKFDEFQKHLDNLLGSRLGNRFHRYLDVHFPEKEQRVFCVVQVKQRSSEPVYITIDNGQEIFYIRRLASTVDLKPSEALKYIREHWD